MARVNFDKGTQRDVIVNATWDVMMRDGLARTSMRAIAHEVGCTTGVLTHHFRDKRDILALALDRISEELATRIREATDQCEGESAAKGLAKGFLPTDQHGRRLWFVWVQFLAEALSDDQILEHHSRQYDWTRKRVVAYFQAMIPNEAVSKKKLALEADYFIALLDGLGINALISQRRYSEKKLADIIERHLTRVINSYQ